MSDFASISAGILAQITVALFIFVLGVPAIILQFAIPIELRPVYRRHRIAVYYPVVISSLLLLAMILLFLAHIPPTISTKGSICSNSDWLYFPIIAIALGLAGFQLYISTSGAVARRLIGSLRLWIIIWMYFKKCLNYVKLNDIVSIGIYGKAGHEKDAALGALEKLTEEIQRSESFYDGRELEAFLRRFAEIVTNPVSPGNEKNFRVSVRTLIGVYRTACQVSSSSDTLDARLAIRALTTIGEVAVASNRIVVLKTLMTHLQSNEDAIYRIGKKAVNSSQYNFATDAMAKLYALALRRIDSAPDSTSAYFLALATKFCESKSDSFQADGKAFLENYFKLQTTQQKQLKDSAIEFFKQRADCDAADYIKAI